jgi:IMP dehydrogenase|tara:strand:+ start:41220 stop:42227 length:1008 start_codon:yes stop_codon:yes gene_type:complete
MFKNALSFDDVLLSPQYSDIKSRSEIDLTRVIGKTKFSLPIISSPMDTVTESEMASVMYDRGGLGVLHRYNTIEKQCDMVRDSELRVIAAAVGVSGDYEERAWALYDSGVKIMCIDVAHGHHKLMKSALKTLKQNFGDEVSVIAGNVATPDAYKDLSYWGADAVRVGIGGGSICSTRIQTGHGMPTFQSVYDCARSDCDVPIIADGGIKSAGDIVKSLAAGADFVMLGSLLAGTDESPGESFSSVDGKSYKVYRGMASVEAQTAWRGETRSLEGVSTTIPHKGSVLKILDSLKQNIRSGLSYSGCRNITQLQTTSKFIQQSTSGLAESHTHILPR